MPFFGGEKNKNQSNPERTNLFFFFLVFNTFFINLVFAWRLVITKPLVDLVAFHSFFSLDNLFVRSF